ncbi:MAG TPA: hypothetical protein VGX68_03335 [Thermoanaerobaculia bacterium]|nr:hypothetical protein [Thermoanaerobaculia bacterium]
MKKSALVLLTLLALAPFAQLMAQTPPAAPPPTKGAVTPVPDLAEFLATLAGGQTQAPSDLVPAPAFKANCVSSSECPTGQLCCFMCGNPPDDGSSCKFCVTPVRGRCPLVV